MTEPKGMVRYYPSWEEAAEASVFNKAVSDPVEIQYKGKTMRIEYIKPRYGDAWAVPEGRGFRLEDFRVHSSDVDRIRRWRRY